LDVSRLHVGEAVVDLTFRRDKERVAVDVVKLDGQLEVHVRLS
jgi:hypothetical protein